MKDQVTLNDQYARTSFLSRDKTQFTHFILYLRRHIMKKPSNYGHLFHHFAKGLSISLNYVSKHNMSVHGIRNENCTDFSGLCLLSILLYV